MVHHSSRADSTSITKKFNRFHTLVNRVAALCAATVALGLFIWVLPPLRTFAAGLPPVQIFYIPLPEDQIRTSLLQIYSSTGATMHSVTGLSITADGTQLYYDQWENGYDADLANPTNLYSASNLGGTQIWGDGNSANGAPPGIPSDILNAGSVIILENDVAIPRNPATILYDGRDKIGSTKVIAIAKSAWATTPGTVLADAIEIVDTTRWGTEYKIPIGQDLSSSYMFEYTSLLVMASADNTVVQIDKDGNGTVDLTQTLNQGQSYQVNGGINSNASITASAPVQIDLLTGDIGSSYESRWFTIAPISQWDSTYYTPVGTTSATYPANVWIYNPNASAITVNYQTKASSGNFSVAAKGAYRFYMPSLSGGHFYTSDNRPFFAAGTMDSSDTGANQTFDWGYTLVPESSLTSAFAVGWAPGNATLTGNGSPVWVTAVNPTTIYVDYDGNGTTGALTDPNGRKYDVAYALSAFESKQIYDPDKDQTGMRVYTVDGTLITGAYGEDPTTAAAGTPYLDVGYSIPPLPQVVLDKTGQVANDANSNGLLDPGETIAYTITARNLGVVTFFNTIISDSLPTNVTYITGTAAFNGTPITDSTSPASAFPLDEGGLNIGNIPVGGKVQVTYQVQAKAAPPFYTTIENQVTLNVGGEIFTKKEILPVNAPTITQCTADFTNSSGATVTSYQENATFYVQVNDGDTNVNHSSAESITVDLRNNTTSDRESITLTETGVNTGIFRGSLPSSTLAGQVANDGTIYVRVGDTVVVTYTDATFGDTCNDTITIPPPTKTKVLYLSDPSQALDRVDPVATGDGTTASTASLASSSGAITIDGAATKSKVTGGTSLTFNHTTGSGSNRLLLVGVSFECNGASCTSTPDPTVSSVKFNNQNLTFLGRATASSNDAEAELWYMFNPPASTTASVVVQLVGSTNQDFMAGAITFAGVDQSQTLSAQKSSGNSTTPSVTVNSATGETVFAVVSWDDPPTTRSAGSGQSELWYDEITTGSSGNTKIGGAASTKAGAASVTMSWTASTSQWGIVGTSLKPAASSGGASTTFTQTLAMADDFIIPVGSAITVTNYISVAAGTPTTGMAVTATVKSNGTTFATLANPTVTSVGGAIYKVVWAGTLGSAKTIAAGQAVNLNIANGVSSLAFKILYDSSTYPSKLELPTTTVIEINDFGIYDAAYPDSTQLTGAINGDIVYVRATVSDPFGATDITTNTIQITDPNGGVSNVTLNNGHVVASSALTKTVEYAWTTPSTLGNYTVTLTSYEGYEGITDSASTLFNLIFQDTGTPSRAEFTTGNDGTATTSYNANEQVCVRITDIDQNTTAGIDTITAIITSASGDQETVTLTETGADTGIFTACIPASSTTVGANNDATLYAPQGTALVVNYTDPTDPSDTSSANATVKTATPALSLSKQLVTPNNGIARVGDTVRYDIVVGNPGPTILTTASFTDTFPASCLSYQSASITPSSVVTPTLSWSNVGPVASGSSKTVSVYFRADASCALANNLAAAAAVDQNSVPVTTTQATAALITAAPALSVSKTLSTPASGQAEIGDTVVFTLSLVNTGSTTITNLPLTDNYSAACLAYSAASPTPADAADGGIALWNNLGPLSAGNALTLTVSFTVVGACSPTANSIDVSAATDVYSNTVPAVQASAAITTVAASIGQSVWDDLDGDGTQDVGEPGLANVVISLTLPSGLVITATADVSGTYTFTKLPSGNYTATVDTTTLPLDYFATTNNSPLPVTLTPGQNLTSANFGYQAGAVITGHLFEDLNGSGSEENGETALVSITVIITDSHGFTHTVTTDSNGDYSVTVPAGSTTADVDESTLPTGYVQTAGSDPSTVTAPSGNTVSAGIDGYQPQGTITGAVYEDMNGNGSYDAGDLPLGGVIITLSNGQIATTNASGVYSFTVIPGTYTLTETNPSGYGSTGDTTGANDDQITGVTVTSGGSTTGHSFFDAQPVTINGHVYDDQDGDGSYDAGDLPIEGVDLLLSNSMTATTDANGVYTFTNVMPGSYAIAEINPNGYTSTGDVEGTNDDTINLTVTSGNAVTGQDFLDTVFVGISGHVYDDLNGDGNFDAGEPGIEGVVLTLSSGPAATTNASGNYSFTNLLPGTYAITETNPSGYTSTGDTDGANNDQIANVTLTSGGSSTGNNFFDALPVTITGTVYDDQAGDGSYDAGDVGLSGVVITLNNGPIATTDANGVYTFTNVLPGNYTLVETNPNGYTSTGDSDGTDDDTITLTITSGSDSTGNDFFDAQPGTINGYVYDDLNGDGNYDAGDLPIEGVVITLSSGPTATTDANGVYTFTNVLPSSYAIAEINPNGYTSTGDVEGTNDDTINLTVTSGKAVTGQDFLDTVFVGISGHVYDDLNGDGNFDAGEPGLEGVVLLLSTGPTATTTASGNYSFTNLLPGTYAITETNPSGYTSTGDTDGANDDRIANITLTSGGSSTSNNFFDALPVTITGNVYGDQAGDGSYDAGDVGLSGVVITLNNGPIATTDANGAYTFTNVLPGVYTLVETNPNGYTSTGDSDGTNDDTITLTLTSGSDRTGNDFFDAQPVTINGHVYDDQDGDGSYDAGDLPIEGVVITLSTGPTATTDANGVYTFTNVLPGSYAIAEINPNGYTSTGDVEGTNDDTINLTVTSGKAVTGQDFLDTVFVGISGHVYDDLNGDGNFDAGEPGLEGVVLLLSTGPTATTTASGNYSFTNLLPGTYAITETNPSGYTSTGDTDGANDDRIANITLTSGGSSTSNNFFDALPVTITGTVYGDQAGDGSYDAGDVGLSGVVITLNNGPIATTDANGVYTFTNVLPGVYTLVETNPNGYTSTGDSDGTNDDTITLTVTSGSDRTGNDFFDAQPVTINGHVYDDQDGDGSYDAGDLPIEGVVITLSAGPTATTDANGVYTFTNVLPGTYTITETNPNGYTSTGDSYGANDDTITITLTSGKDVTGQNFLDTAFVGISGHVYDDLDGDGNFDAGEPGIKGVVITLSNGLTATTNASGNYTFTNIVPGGYTITETNPSGYTSTGDTDGTNDDTIANVTLISGGSSTGNNFFDAQSGTLIGTVYNDLNGNGSFDPGEPGLSGVLLTLSNGLTTTTAANGIYTFTVLPGLYTITETNPSGYTSNGDAMGANDDRIPDRVVTSGGSSGGHDFFDSIHDLDVTATPRCIYGVPHLEYAITPIGFIPGANPLTMRWRALDDNALLYEYTGLPLSGLMLWPEAQVDSNGRGIAWPGWQWVNGVYHYVGSKLRPQVKLEVSVNPTKVLIISYPKPLPTCIAEPPSHIGDRVWLDINQDGRQGGDEPGLAAVALSLLDGNQSVITTTVSDDRGYYTFTLPLTGTYYLSVTPPLNYRVTRQNQGDDALDSDADLHGIIGPLTIITVTTDQSNDIGLYYPLAPLANPDQGQGQVGQPVAVPVLNNDSPNGQPLDPTTVRIVNPPAGAILSGDGKTLTVPGEGVWTVDSTTGAITFTPDSSFGGNPTPIDYVVNDQSGLTSNPASITVTYICTENGAVTGQININGTYNDRALLTLEPTDAPGAVTLLTVTDGQGNFRFSNVLTGTYTVVVQDATLNVQGLFPLNSSLRPNTVVVGCQTTTVAPYAYGPATTGVLGDFVWYDVNGNNSTDEWLDTDQSGEVTKSPLDYNTAIPLGNFEWVDLNNDNRYDGPENLGELNQCGLLVTSNLIDILDGTNSVINQQRTGSLGYYRRASLTLPGSYSTRINNNDPALLAAADATARSGLCKPLPSPAAQGRPSTPLPSATGFTAGVQGGHGLNANGLQCSLVSTPLRLTTLTVANSIDLTLDFAVACVGFQLTPDHTTTTFPGTVVTYTHTLSNTGTAPDTYTITALSSQGYPVTINTPTVTLAAGSSATIVIRVTVPLTATSANVDLTTVTATSQHVPSVTAKAEDTTKVTDWAQVGDLIWHDKNNNGLVDSDEPGLANVTVQLLRVSDDATNTTLVATTSTDANGKYTFANVVPGRYLVNLPTPPFGYPRSSTSTGLLDDQQDNDDNGIQEQNGGAVHSPLITLNGQNQTVDFGFFAPITIGDLVWYDRDGDGVQSANEVSIPGLADNTLGTVGVSGISVTLYDAVTNSPLATTMTDNQGHYHFTDLLPGSYYMHFDVPAAYQIAPANVATDHDAFDSDVDPTSRNTPTVVVTSGQQETTLDLGLILASGQAPVTLGDWVWYDANANGVQDSTESGVPGIPVALYRADDTLVATTITAADGHYQFAMLPPGDYYLRFTPPTGYLITAANVSNSTEESDSDVDPATGRTALLTLSSSERNNNQDLGLTMTATPGAISGTAWLDLNQDGIQDATEPILAAVQVTLYDANGQVVATTLTDVNGRYDFNNLLPGGYSLVFTIPDGYQLAASDQGDDDARDSDAIGGIDGLTGYIQALTLAPGETLGSLDYGLHLAAAPVTLGDAVWLDADADGVQDSNEIGVQGVVVKLYNAAGKLLMLTQTDASGRYQFTNLPGASYFVEFVLPDNFSFSPVSSAPTTDKDSNADAITGRTTLITVNVGVTEATVDAGIYQRPTELENGNEPSQGLQRLFLPLVRNAPAVPAETAP